jgi:hypothetical protein
LEDDVKSIAMNMHDNVFAIENNRWRMTQTRLEFLAQKVRHAISIFLNEWFFNPSLGIPYIPKQDDGKVMHRRLIETRLQTTITGVEGIARLVSFVTELDKGTRELTVTFVAQIDSGETFEDSIVI